MLMIVIMNDMKADECYYDCYYEFYESYYQ